jgi:hypothetical protein
MPSRSSIEPGNGGYLGDVGLEHIPVGGSLANKSLKKHIFSHAVRSTGLGF